MPTHFFHSGMTGAPTNTSAAGSTLNIIDACLNTGFNVRAVQSASVTDNAMTLTYASAHGYESLCLLRLDGAAGGSIVRRCTVTGANTLTIPVTGFGNGAVAGTLETRVAPADWERVFSDTNIGVFRSKVIGPGSNRFFYRVADTVVGSYPDMFRGFEAMTDANTGTDPFPTVAQAAGEGIRVLRADTPAPWVLIADQRTCYVGKCNSVGSLLDLFAFGDATPYNSADAFFSGFSPLDTLSNSSSSNAYVARNAGGTVKSTPWRNILTMGVTSGTSARTFPSPITGGMTFARPVLMLDGQSENDPIRGQRRGLMHCSANPTGAEQGGAPWRVFDVVMGVQGRVVVVSDRHVNGCVALPVDEDWA